MYDAFRNQERVKMIQDSADTAASDNRNSQRLHGNRSAMAKEKKDALVIVIAIAVVILLLVLS